MANSAGTNEPYDIFNPVKILGNMCSKMAEGGVSIGLSLVKRTSALIGLLTTRVARPAFGAVLSSSADLTYAKAIKNSSRRWTIRRSSNAPALTGRSHSHHFPLQRVTRSRTNQRSSYQPTDGLSTYGQNTTRLHMIVRRSNRQFGPKNDDIPRDPSEPRD